RGIHTPKKRPRENLSYRPSKAPAAEENGSESLDKQAQNIRRSNRLTRIEPPMVNAIPSSGSERSPQDTAIGTTQLCGKTMEDPAEKPMGNKGIGTSATQSQLPAQTLAEQSRVTAPFTEEVPSNITGVPDSSS